MRDLQDMTLGRRIVLTIVIVLSGVAIFGYFAAQLFDEIAHGVLGGEAREHRETGTQRGGEPAGVLGIKGLGHGFQ